MDKSENFGSSYVSKFRASLNFQEVDVKSPADQLNSLRKYPLSVKLSVRDGTAGQPRSRAHVSPFPSVLVLQNVAMSSDFHKQAARKNLKLGMRPVNRFVPDIR